MTKIKNNKNRNLKPATHNLQLSIAWMYPDLMGTYGDRGNIICLTKRCQWRGVNVKIKNITLETSAKELETCDLIFMGGAQDRQQKLAGPDFLHKKGPIVKKMVENNIPGLFVCAAYQAVGHYYRPYQGEKIPGPGIFDLYTVHPGDQAKRLIGNVVAEIIQNSAQTIVGFENHGGRTYLGKNIKPLARIKRGFGNNGEDGYEGAVFKNAVGSYFHGPILPKNPHIADWLIGRALEVRYGKVVELEPLDDSLEWKAHKFMLKKLKLL